MKVRRHVAAKNLYSTAFYIREKHGNKISKRSTSRGPYKIFTASRDQDITTLDWSHLNNLSVCDGLSQLDWPRELLWRKVWYELFRGNFISQTRFERKYDLFTIFTRRNSNSDNPWATPPCFVRISTQSISSKSWLSGLSWCCSLDWWCWWVWLCPVSGTVSGFTQPPWGLGPRTSWPPASTLWGQTPCSSSSSRRRCSPISTQMSWWLSRSGIGWQIHFLCQGQCHARHVQRRKTRDRWQINYFSCKKWEMVTRKIWNDSIQYLRRSIINQGRRLYLVFM